MLVALALDFTTLFGPRAAHFAQRIRYPPELGKLAQK